MIPTIYVIFNLALAAVLLFFKYGRQNLHTLEVFTYWLIGALLAQNYSAFTNLNFKLFEVPDILSLEMTHFLNRIVLVPVVFVWFLNSYVTGSSFIKKLVLVSSTVCVLVGLEWLEDGLGVLIHNNWRLWWSFAAWSTSTLLTIGFMKIFRKKLIREVPST
jgi:hypothetical protein